MQDFIKKLSPMQVQVPFLVDPNTDVKLGNYEDILQYLFKNYSSHATLVST